MNASKESCRETLRMVDNMLSVPNPDGEGLRNVRLFLEAALKRLPSEAAIEKDRKRKTEFSRRKRSEAKKPRTVEEAMAQDCDPSDVDSIDLRDDGIGDFMRGEALKSLDDVDLEPYGPGSDTLRG